MYKHSALCLTLRITFRLWSSWLVTSRGCGIRSGGGGIRSGGSGSSLPLWKHPAPEAAALRRI